MRARSARTTAWLVAAVLAACLLLPVLSASLFRLAVEQRVISPPELHANLALIHIDTARVLVQKCPAPPMFCMPQDAIDADQQIYTVRVSIYTAPNSAPVFTRQVMAVRVRGER